MGFSDTSKSIQERTRELELGNKIPNMDFWADAPQTRMGGVVAFWVRGILTPKNLKKTRHLVVQHHLRAQATPGQGPALGTSLGPRSSMDKLLPKVICRDLYEKEMMLWVLPTRNPLPPFIMPLVLLS